MEIVICLVLAFVLVAIVFRAIIKGGVKLDQDRRQDLADRINAGAKK